MKTWLMILAMALLTGCAGSDMRHANEARSSAASENDNQRRAKIRTELAASYFVEGNPAVALDEIATALKADSSYAPAYSVRGLVQLSLGENEAGESSFRKALELAPNDPEINNNYGWFLCKTAREKDSFAYFMSAIKNPLYQTPERSWVNSGLCAMQIKDYKRAEEFLHKANVPGRAGYVALYPLALLEFERGTYRQARGWVAELHRVAESSAESLWLALRIERKLGDRSAEGSYSAQLRRRFPDSKETRELLRGNFE